MHRNHIEIYAYNIHMDIDKLLRALDKDENEDLIDTTSESLRETVSSVLSELHITRQEQADLLVKLDGYKYIEDISSLHTGAYIRWICLIDPSNIRLTKGAIVCDIKFTDTGISVVCKGYHHKHFQLKFDECLIFQRLSDQERVLLSALDYLSK